MHIALKTPYLSIKEMNEFDLPDFAVLIGRNGVGKTHLLDAIAKGHASADSISTSEISKYNLDSFQPKEPKAARRYDSSFTARTLEQYFFSRSGRSLANTSKQILEDIREQFGLKQGSVEFRAFEEKVRQHLRRMPAFSRFEPIPGTDATSTYSERIAREVISSISTGTQRSDSLNNNPALLVSLAMKLTAKLPHELCHEDIVRAAHYEGDPLANQLSEIFTKYKIEQYVWAHTEGDAGRGVIQDLKAEYERRYPPPWSTLRTVLQRMRDVTDNQELFAFEFTDPQNNGITFSNHSNYSFQTRFRNCATGESYSIENLSSGEKILVSLCLAAFNQAIGCRQPTLVLLDEIDSVLHPSMISALISGLKDLFTNNNARVVMATHSVTTVSLLEDGEIFRLARTGGKIEVQSASKAEAVAELSEGLATIDTGLKIATSGGAALIMILTEGHNALHLKRWANLFFPGTIAVFEELPDKTNNSQLLAYGRLLSKMDTTFHVLVVWDCDAAGLATRLSKELAASSHVTAFAFKKRENVIASSGIENVYAEKYLEKYCNITSEASTNKVVARSMSGPQKKTFATHVCQRGTMEYFEHYHELKAVVEDIVKRAKRKC